MTDCCSNHGIHRFVKLLCSNSVAVLARCILDGDSYCAASGKTPNLFLDSFSLFQKYRRHRSWVIIVFCRSPLLFPRIPRDLSTGTGALCFGRWSPAWWPHGSRLWRNLLSCVIQMSGLSVAVREATGSVRLLGDEAQGTAYKFLYIVLSCLYPRTCASRKLVNKVCESRSAAIFTARVIVF